MVKTGVTRDRRRGDLWGSVLWWIDHSHLATSGFYPPGAENHFTLTGEGRYLAVITRPSCRCDLPSSAPIRRGGSRGSAQSRSFANLGPRTGVCPDHSAVHICRAICGGGMEIRNLGFTEKARPVLTFRSCSLSRSAVRRPDLIVATRWKITQRVTAAEVERSLRTPGIHGDLTWLHVEISGLV
jgi:hypothetical protein